MANDSRDGAWFAPKRYGIGAGLPVAWQGWAILIGTIAIVAVVAAVFRDKPIIQAALILPLLVVLMIISARKTRGGWRWRWGDEEKR